MQLKPRTTYRNGRGLLVHIAGPARTDEPRFWSIEGDHYTPEGVYCGVVFAANADQPAPPHDGGYSIVEEAADSDPQWWEGVAVR